MARKKLPEELREGLITIDSAPLITLQLASSLFGVQDQTLRNWAIPEKYSEYEPIVMSLSDVINAYILRNSTKIEKLKNKVEDLQNTEVDHNQMLKKELTKTAKLKNAQLELKLIAYAPLEQYLFNLTQQFLGVIDDIASRVSPKVVGCKTHQEAYLLLRDEMRYVKNVLADISLDAYDSKPIGIEMDAPDGFTYNKDTDSFIREEPKPTEEE